MQPTHVELEGDLYPITITRRPRARRYVLRVDSKDQQIKLTVPSRASIKGGIEFTQSRANWIFQQLHKARQHMALVPGVAFPLLGLPTLLMHQPGRGVAELDEAEQPQTLMIYGDGAFFQSRLKRYLKQYLKDYLDLQVKFYAEKLGAEYSKISVRDTSSHWGSCTPDGKLSFAFRLVFAEPHLVDYIVAHEVAHLKEMNHSPAFWKLVGDICPDYKHHRKWFKQYGEQLNQYKL